MHFSCRSCTSPPNAGQQTRYFKVDFNNNGIIFLFFLFQRNTLNLEKKALVKKMFGSYHRSNRIYLLRNCFSDYISQRNVNNVKGWRNFVCTVH